MSTNNLPVTHAAHFATTSHAEARSAVSRNLAEYRRQAHSTVPNAGFRWTLRLISLVALATSSYLAWIAFTAGSVAGCGSGATFDCSHVLSSSWSSLLGIPVSFPAVVLYAMVSALLIVPASWKLSQWRWPLIAFAAFLAGFGGLWFIGLQIFLLKHLCFYCLVVHGCGLVLAALVASHPLTRSHVSLRLVATAAIAVLLFATAQIAAQYFLAPAEKFQMVEYDAAPAAEMFAAPGATSQLDQPVFPSPTAGDDDRVDPGAAGERGSTGAHPGADQGEIFESPLRSPTPDKSTRVAPLRNSWLYAFNPALLLTTQVAAGKTTASGEQKAAATQKTEAAQPQRKLVSILNGVQLDVSQWPLLGHTDAKYVIVEMLDYTCGHCQNTHAAIHGAMQSYGDQLAVVVLPVPLDAKCNPQINATGAEHREACEIAKLAIAVWHVAPERFTEFHGWLLESKPQYAQALAHAETLVDPAKLHAELQSTVPSDFIKANLKLYQRASAGAIPKILFPRTSAVGEMRSKDSLISLIERELVNGPK